MKHQWALVSLLIAATCSTAEVLSLQECIDLAMQNNLQHQMDQQNPRQQSRPTNGGPSAFYLQHGRLFHRP